MNDVHIECPKCEWEPDGGEHWACACGTVWDTFSTQAQCPNCNKRWQFTQCPTWPGGCGQRSPHIDWYKIPLDIEGLIEESLKIDKKKKQK